MKAILTRGLKKLYHPTSRKIKHPVQALEDLNLEVESGEIYGFIGPNGAGKTTAIKLLVGLISPTAGDAFIFDQPSGSVAARRKLGYLSEISCYYPFMEAGELLDYYARLFGMPKRERKKRVEDVLSLVNLAEWKNYRLSDFSKGMLQRFGIAQAMVSRPPLLILDEPTSGLDPIGQKEIKDIILNLKAQGLTIFFSSHKLTEVEHICDQIGIIHKGKMLRVDKLENILALPPLPSPSPTPQKSEARLPELQPVHLSLEEVFFDLIKKAESPQ